MLIFYFRRNTNRLRADEQLERLKDQLLLQQFLQECDEVSHLTHSPLKLNKGVFQVQMQKTTM